MREDPRSAYLHLRLGETLLALGDADDADVEAGLAIEHARGPGERVAGLRLRAVAREQLGDDDGSISALRAALSQQPDRAASAMLAERLVKRGELGAAEEVVSAWMAAEPGAVFGWVALARVFAEHGELDRAVAIFQRARAIHPDDEVFAGHIDLLWALGRFDEAALLAAERARVSGDSGEVRTTLLTALALKDKGEAQRVAAHWLDDDGSDEQRLLVADAFERAGLFDDARAALRVDAPRALLALEHARLLLHPGKDATATATARAQARGAACAIAERATGDERLADYSVSVCTRARADSGDVDGAVVFALDVAKSRPKSSRVLDALRGAVRRASPAKKAAVRQHLESIEPTLLPGEGDVDVDASIVVAAAFAYVDVDAPARGRALMLRALAARPHDDDLAFGNARLLERTAAPGKDGDAEARAAVELVERLHERSGKSVDSLNFVAFTLAERGLRGDDARRLAFEAALREPLNGYVLDTWGWATLQAGDVDGALALLQRADRLSPHEGEIWFHIASALHKKRDAVAARAAAARARAYLDVEHNDALLARLAALESELATSSSAPARGPRFAAHGGGAW